MAEGNSFIQNLLVGAVLIFVFRLVFSNNILKSFGYPHAGLVGWAVAVVSFIALIFIVVAKWLAYDSEKHWIQTLTGTIGLFIIILNVFGVFTYLRTYTPEGIAKQVIVFIQAIAMFIILIITIYIYFKTRRKNKK